MLEKISKKNSISVISLSNFFDHDHNLDIFSIIFYNFRVYLCFYKMDAIYCITENYYFYVYLMEDQSETKNQEVDYE